MANVEWRGGIPSHGSFVGLGAKDIRHQKKAVADWLGESFQFPDKTNPLKQGATRPLILTESTSSFSVAGGAGSDHTFKGVFLSDTSQYLVYWRGQKGPPSPGSRSRIMHMGGPNFIEDNSDPGTDVTIRVSGITELSSPDSQTFRIPYGDAGFKDTDVHIFVTSSNSDYIVHPSAVQASYFELDVQPVSGTASNVTIHWSASGVTDGTI